MNWKNIISELRLVKVTQQQIAAFCGCGQATISDLHNGKTKSPAYETGVAIVALHKKHSKAIRKQVEV
jgi:transcriptional regulator with XRE-family HTH domain